MDDDLDPLLGDVHAIHPDLHLYRVRYKGTVTTLVAAHFYSEACAELRRVWPRRKTAEVWADAGVATNTNLRGWRDQIINPTFPPVLMAKD